MGARWSDGDMALVRFMWAEGRTASDIAAHLTSLGPAYVSRNMVIGKAHRMGLEARPSPIVRT